MKPGFLSKIFRSMYGQLVILALLFAAVLTYLFLSETFLNVLNSEPSPMEQSTELRVSAEIHTFVGRESDPNSDNPPLEEYPVIRQVVAANPGFTYFIHSNGKEYTNSVLGENNLEQFLLAQEAVQSALREGQPCHTVSNRIPPESEKGAWHSHFRFCDGELLYFEFSGIEVPISPADNVGAGLQVFFTESRNWQHLYATAGMVILVLLVLAINFRSLNRVTSVARSIDPEKLDTPLPEKGLPAEVQPLVEAINQMIREVDEVHKKHKFFLSTAAHEVRTPLTVLRTRLEQIDDSKLKTELIKDVRRLISLANQLLNLMRTGGPQDLTESVDLVACCKKVIAQRAPLMVAQGISISLDTEVKKLKVSGDAGLIEVAIANLIDNAMSFSKKGQEVEVTLTEQGCLSVRDHGRGIAKKDLPNIFESFAKFPPNRSGHGLGLAIVKSIVTIHNAQIEAANAEGGGAEFAIQFAL